MEYKYKCIEQHLYHEDIGNYTTYGIVLENCEEFFIDDVSCDRSFAEYLVSLLNTYQAEPVHLFDIVEDFMP